MQIFEDEDAFLTTEVLVEHLKAIAKVDAEEQEYPPEEHTCWFAAEAIEKLVAMLEGKNFAALMQEAVRRLTLYEIEKENPN